MTGYGFILDYWINLFCPSSLDPPKANPYLLAAMILEKIPTLIISILLAGPTYTLDAQQTQEAAGQQLLLLHNGQALEGQISRMGNLYRVVLPDGEIRIKAADVDLLCKDLEEGYQRKRAAISVGNLRDHLDLAQWCERHRLYDHAAAELADAAAIAPGNPIVSFMQRRLQITTEPQPDRPKTETAPDNSQSNDELDRMIRALPQKAVENFTQSVQPLLMNNCTASNCHGPQSASGLRIQRTASDEPAGRRMTQRNISAVLRYVDRNNPLASRILTVPIAPHGPAKTAVFTDHQAAQYKRLMDWVLQLGPTDMPDLPATIPNTQPMLADAIGDAGTPPAVPHTLSRDARKAKPLPPVKFEHGAAQAAFQAAASKFDERDESCEESKSKAPKIKHGAAPPEFAPKDSFDPEIFNRRYLKPKAADDSPAGDKAADGK